MCGIAGSWRSDWDVDAALNAIVHRGPDGRGVVEAGDAVHGHVRLAIQDPHPRSGQPFRVEQGLTLSYVGELYNYRKLREELERDGAQFKTTGDTEVVAAMLWTYGPAALKRMEGMFAMAWTEGNGTTYLARDRFGKIPLYTDYVEGSLLGDAICWSSERRALPEPSRGMPVPPGYLWELGAAEGALEPYYRLPDRSDVPPGPTGVLAELERATEERLQADVPVCCLCSGGLDSSLILALVKQVKPDVVAYTAYLDPESPDLVGAREVCGVLGVPLREVRVLEPIEGDVSAAVEAIETPMKAQVEIALLCLPLADRIRRDGFKVCLTGEGADELFGGYGNLKRHAGSDEEWRAARRASFEKQERANFIRTNKAFMAHAVEPRLPFQRRQLVERVLGLGLEGCPPGKELLKRAAQMMASVPVTAIMRRKATFQGASGMSAALDDLYGGDQVKTYNDYARELFGGIPRG